MGNEWVGGGGGGGGGGVVGWLVGWLVGWSIDGPIDCVDVWTYAGRRARRLRHDTTRHERTETVRCSSAVHTYVGAVVEHLVRPGGQGREVGDDEGHAVFLCVWCVW